MIVATFSVQGKTIPELWSRALEVASGLYDCDVSRFDPKSQNSIPVHLDRVHPLVESMSGDRVTVWKAEVRCGP